MLPRLRYMLEIRRQFGHSAKLWALSNTVSALGDANHSNLQFGIGALFHATDKWKYKGKPVLLIYELVQSAAETAGQILKTANGAKFVGSHTPDANETAAYYCVPRNIRLWSSGMGWRDAVGSQLQRVGLVPDIEVKPTIMGS